MLTPPHGLVDAAWLRDRPGSDHLCILDASAAMPGEAFDAERAFLEGHVPGARRFDIEAFADPDTELPHMAPSAGRFARLAGALGIDDRSVVVVYDRGPLFSAPRAWWLFRLFGHENVQVLDGGLAAWRDAGGAIETGPATAAAPARFTPRLRTDRIAGLGDIENGASPLVLVDARAVGRFDGTAPEPRPGIRAGHIPGSRNLPFGHLLAPGGTMKPPDALRAAFGTVGVDERTPVVTTCGTGVTAAVLSLGLHVAGLADAALYDGSWTEYATAHPQAGS